MENLSKAKQKWIRSLQQKKHRDEENLFVVEGEKMVLEGLTHFGDHLVYVVAQTGSEALIPQKFQAIACVTTEKEFEQISTLKTPNKLLAIFQRPEARSNENEMGIALDGVQDPGNMGTILRLADWFGISQIVCSEDTVDCFNPKVVQASMGAIFRVQVVYTDLEAFLQESSQPSYAAMLNGKHYKEVDYPKNALLVMGNEGKGIRPEVHAQIQHDITIPKFGEAESLNVATATAILLAEMVGK